MHLDALDAALNGESDAARQEIALNKKSRQIKTIKLKMVKGWQGLLERSQLLSVDRTIKNIVLTVASKFIS